MFRNSKQFVFLFCSDLNNIGETGVFYRKMSIGPHIVSNAEDPVYSRYV